MRTRTTFALKFARGFACCALAACEANGTSMPQGVEDSRADSGSIDAAGGIGSTIPPRLGMLMDTMLSVDPALTGWTGNQSDVASRTSASVPASPTRQQTGQS
jgi:hypothetical protein